MFKALISEGKEYQIEEKDGSFHLDNELFDIDLQKVSDHYYHIIYQNQSYRAELVDTNYEEKSFLFKINGAEVSVQLKDRFDLLLEKMGMSELSKNTLNEIKAPMPGLIIEIKVAEGTEVKKGDPLLILEAMKMENIIKSPGEGVIKEIKVKKGDGVEKNQVLIQF